MNTDEMICKCKQVSYSDVENALHQTHKFDDVLETFDEVQKLTHCSTGCGGCHDKIMDAISEIMSGNTQYAR
ncbi:MAG: (2Fe-2S)-binding protein [Eubacteriales bacterium]|nr:(2Fe-2S)-binding protein [Eubacteriales bacterium]